MLTRNEAAAICLAYEVGRIKVAFELTGTEYMLWRDSAKEPTGSLRIVEGCHAITWEVADVRIKNVAGRDHLVIVIVPADCCLDFMLEVGE